MNTSARFSFPETGFKGNYEARCAPAAKVPVLARIFEVA
jgi:hypothetical protein